MTFLSKAITTLGSILLVHACYSAREHTALQSLRSATVAALASSPPAATSLPLDIILETIFSTLAILLGLVLGTRALRPIEWRVWAGKIEREGEEGFRDQAGVVDKDFMGNPFSVFESRPNFVDIRKQRKEFAEWMQKGGETPAL